MNINFEDDQPIIIGLSGKAGSGKTSVAENIVPKGAIETFKYGIKWDHIFYALPLYELASSRRNIMGSKEESRKLYAIHEVLFDIFGSSSIGNIPDYEDFIEMVYDMYSLPIEPEGTKPRSFLQAAGDLCKQFDVNCFSNWGIRKAKSIYKNYLNEFYTSQNASNSQDPTPMAIIISDVRYENEAKKILEQPNGIVICFEANNNTLNERLFKRDGKLMEPQHAAHSSEQHIDDIMNYATAVIDTNNMTVDEQVEATINAIGIKKVTNA